MMKLSNMRLDFILLCPRKYTKFQKLIIQCWPIWRGYRPTV